MRHRSSVFLYVALLGLILGGLGTGGCGADPASPDQNPKPDTGLPANPDGIFLPGDPEDTVGSQIVEMKPSPVPAEDVTDGLLSTRLDAWIDINATVAEMNAALEATGTRIVSMRKGNPLVTLRIDAVASLEEAQAKADVLQALPEFFAVLVAELARAEPVELDAVRKAEQIPAESAMPVQLDMLFMGAAWNSLARARTLADRVPVLVMDVFSSLETHPEIPSLRFPGTINGIASPGSNHGWHVAGTIAARSDGGDPVGLHPDPVALLDMIALPIGGLSWAEMQGDLIGNFPSTGKFVISTSLGWAFDPADANANGGSWPTQKLVNGAVLAMSWRIATVPHWNRFIHATAAGNEREYSGNMADGRIESPWTIAHFYADPREIFDDGTLDSAQENALDVIMNAVQTSFPAAAVVQPNVIVVGSSNFFGFESDFSNNFSEIRALGEGVYSTCLAAQVGCSSGGMTLSGTSMATPQIAGLAAWLWNLNNDLTPLDVYDRLLRGYTSSGREGFTNGYMLTLSADPSLANSPLRRSVLDVAGGGALAGSNGRFDESDIQLYLMFFESYELARQVAENPDYDYSRYDLNGDNDTGGFGSASVDLDVNGLPNLSTVSFDVAGVAKELDENEVTDLDCLCYYAYSSLYDGDTAVRDQLLRGPCGGEPNDIVVEITGMPDRIAVDTPVEITIRAGQVVDGNTQYVAGTEISMSTNGGSASPNRGLTDAAGVFKTFVTLYSSENEISVEAVARSGATAEGRLTVSAIRPNQIEIVSSRATIASDVFSLFCTDVGVPCTNSIQEFDFTNIEGFATFDRSFNGFGAANMAGMAVSGETSVTGRKTIQQSGGNFTGATISGQVSASISLSDPNLEIQSYHAQSAAEVDMRIYFNVWGEAATYSVSGSVTGAEYDVDLDGQIQAFECDDNDAPCSSLVGSGSLPPGAYSFSAYVRASKSFRWNQGCTDCSPNSGTLSASGSMSVNLTVGH